MGKSTKTNSAAASLAPDTAGPLESRSAVTTGAARPPSAPVVVFLPTPPSANACWRNVPGRGRVRTGAYNEWRSTTAWLAVSQARGRCLTGKFAVEIEVERWPRSRQSDLDNRIKPLLDALQVCGLIVNDSNVEEIGARWCDSGAWRGAANYDLVSRTAQLSNGVDSVTRITVREI